MKRSAIVLSLALIFPCSSMHARRRRKQQKALPQELIVEPKTQEIKTQPTPLHPYAAKTFDLADVTGLSKPQLDQHQRLYKGYVKKRNQIQRNLQTVDRSNVANITYSKFRGLKIAETFAHNGMILHELYFENLGSGTKIGPQATELLAKNFGSIEQFERDLIDCASCARGWVVTGYSIDDGTIKNFVLDAHNETVPVLVLPILVIDIYEHAYMIDFGIDRASYLKTVWKNIDWHAVETRIAKWVNKFYVAPKK